jgi:SAM-dependent methyltransferase
MLKYKQSCRSCNHNDLKKIIDLGDQPIQGSFIYPNKPKPPTRCIDSTIMICDVKTGGCGLVQNKVSIAPEILYSNYGYRSSVSNTMKDHLKDLVERIVIFLKSKDIYPERVLDIGANDLYMLKQYEKNIQKIGIDPSDIINQVEKDDIEVINDCYPSSKIHGKFDIISSIACFYDIEDPTSFCKEIEKSLKDNGIWVVEFAYLPEVYNKLAYDGMVHEHVCLYSVATFEHILKRVGLKLIKLEENDTNGGSLQAWVAKENNTLFENSNFKQDILKIKIKEFQMALEDKNSYISFEDRIKKHKENLLEVLNKFKSEGKKIHVYGMSTKLNTILSYCGIGANIIECAAERSPEKVGATTINGIPMVKEEDSRKTVDVYLVGPYHFKKEILEREKETIRKGIKFIFPLPTIEII